MTSKWPLKAIAPALLVAGVALLGAGTANTPSSTPAGQANPAGAPPAAQATGHEGHAAASSAASNDELQKPEKKTITGEVMDPACFLEAGSKSIGPRHFQCAVDCARSGQTLAIYDREHDMIYFIAGELPGKNPNDPLMPYIHKKVDVSGLVYHRAGVYGIVISKVVPHVEKTGAAPAAGASAPTK